MCLHAPLFLLKNRISYARAISNSLYNETRGVMFFFTKPKHMTVQLMNLVAVGYTLFRLQTNPDTKFAEVALDLVTHALTLISLQEAPSFSTSTLAVATNLLQTGFILGSITSGGASAPGWISGLDLLGHLCNELTCIITWTHDKKPQDPKA